MKEKAFIILGLVGLGMMLWSAPGFCQDCKTRIYNSERLWLSGKFDESDQELEQALKQCPNMAELYWRKARNIYDRIESLPREKRPSKEERIKLYEQVIALADKCIALEPNNGNCWQWKGIGIGRCGTTKGILNSLSEIDDLEKVFLKAESLKPEYRSENGSANAMGDIYNALGQFYRTVPDWFILKTLFGARGDIDRSVEYQRKAVAREPNRIEYNKELGVSLLCYGQKKNDDKAIAEGRKYLEKVSSLPVLKNSDIVDKDHARILLKNPDLACGYSRDAQQVISKEEFEKTREK